MQNYIDAFVAHNTAEYEKAEADCKAVRAKLKQARKSGGDIAIAATIFGVKPSEVKKVENRYGQDYLTVPTWPGIRFDISGHRLVEAEEKRISAMESELQACCNREKAAKGRNQEKSLLDFRRFVRARFGAKPVCTTKQAIDAYLQTIKPIACAI